MVFQLFHRYSSWLTLQLRVQACTCYNMYVFAGVILCKFCALPCNNLTENLGTRSYFFKIRCTLSPNRDLKIWGWRQHEKRHFKSEVTFFQYASQLFQLTLSNVGELSRRWILKNHNYPSSKKERKFFCFKSWLVYVLNKMWNEAFSCCSHVVMVKKCTKKCDAHPRLSNLMECFCDDFIAIAIIGSYRNIPKVTAQHLRPGTF